MTGPVDALRRPVTIPLTPDQRRQVLAAVGREAVAVEVGSSGPDDEWVVLVWRTEPESGKKEAER